MIPRPLSWLALLAAPTLGLAGEAPAAPGIGAGQLLHVALGLAGVLVAIAVLAWALRNVFRIQASAGNPIRVVAAASVGTRERVLLLQVGEAQLLVGVSPGRVQTLHVLERPLALAPEAAAAAGGFSVQLTRVLGRTRGGNDG